MHLDLKPQNILLNSKNLNEASIKICDLGEAKILGKDLYFRAEEIGTPGYMPPELIQHSILNQVDLIDGTKVDVYEAGICFGYMWSGMEPYDQFWNNNSYTIAAQRLLNERITQGARPNIPGVPKELVSLRDRMVSQIPSDRPSFEEVSYSVQNFCSKHGHFDGK